MNTNALMNRLEIFFYSALISAMSGINHLRARFQGSMPLPHQAVSTDGSEIPQIKVLTAAHSLASSWNSIMESILLLLLWVVLGFAAGFLIGMISPGL